MDTASIKTKRLILRRFTAEDTESLFLILKDKEVNTFLPWFPLKTLEQAQKFLQDRFLAYDNVPHSCHFAVCLKTDSVPRGYVTVSTDDSHDLGYGLRKELWHQGIITEACEAVVECLRQRGFSYITATHDINNPRSGEVMKKIGMTYRYSYVEQVQPKDIQVTFRMYQKNLNDSKDNTYNGYWEKYKTGFIEKNNGEAV